MKIKYTLTKKEKAFLRALHEQPNNSWSGKHNDPFRKEWRDEIMIFGAVNLIKYDHETQSNTLTQQGILLQAEYI